MFILGVVTRQKMWIIDEIDHNGSFQAIIIYHLNVYSMSFNLQICHDWEPLWFNRFIVFALFFFSYGAWYVFCRLHVK